MLIFVSPDTPEKTREFWKEVGQSPMGTVVLDPDFTVIKKYLLFKENDVKGEAIPAVLVIDKDGLLRFKYISQYSSDRPPIEHIEEMLRVVEQFR